MESIFNLGKFEQSCNGQLFDSKYYKPKADSGTFNLEVGRS